jgi:phosphate-selective porin OprO/OprP
MSHPFPRRRELWLAASVTGLVALSAAASRADEPASPAVPPAEAPPAALQPADPKAAAPESPALAAAAPAAPAPAAAPAAPKGSNEDLERRVRELEETVRQLRDALKQQQDSPKQPDKAAVEKVVDDRLKKQKPLVGFQDGFFIQSEDGNFKLRLRALLDFHARGFTSEQGRTGIDNLFLRRARPILEGTVYKYIDFRLMPDFGQGTTVLQDAYVNFRYLPQTQLQVGKFKEPFSLERLQGAADIEFVERSIGNNLSPVRDVGAQVFGDLFKGRVSYAVGGFNGVQDQGTVDNDTDSDKDFAGRVFFQPFRNNAKSPLQGLGVGFAGTGGQRDGTPGPTYRTAGRSPFYHYASKVTGIGDQWRMAPQAYFYYGPFGLMGEHLTSHQGAQKGSVSDNFTNRSWFVQATYVLTGEKASYRAVTPRKPFDPRKGQWGAFEIGGRYSRLDLDDKAFRLGFVDPKISPSEARAWTVGLNWYLNRALKLQFNYERTDFDRAVTFGTDKRDHEDVFLTNVQLAF